MDVKHTKNNSPVINLVEGMPRQLKPFPLAKTDLPIRQKKRKRRYKSIGLFWDDYEILI